MVAACTNGPWVASRKVSAIGPAGPGERSGGSQPATNRRSGASGTSSGTSAGSAGASQITPSRSRTRERGRIGGQPVVVAAQHPGAAEQADLQPAAGPQLPGQRHRVPGVLQRRVEVAEHGPRRDAAGTGTGSGAGAAVGPGRRGGVGPLRRQPHPAVPFLHRPRGMARSARGGGAPWRPATGSRRSAPRRRTASRAPGTAAGRRRRSRSPAAPAGAGSGPGRRSPRRRAAAARRRRPSARAHRHGRRPHLWRGPPGTSPPVDAMRHCSAAG